ncbi:MAG: TetR/AcrR family transcriptional regulator, partial [Bacillota bacterium]|nr:TetR/AcrR family transcriptional regulator [Bacillota bacterium]
VYAYFEDKKDILLACLYRFGETLTGQICEKISSLSFTGNISNTIKNVLRIFVNYHDWSKLLHDEIMSLQYIDNDVKEYFDTIQKTMMTAVTSQLKASGYAFRHEREQTFLLFQMIMGIEDELAFYHSPDIDHEILIDECANAIVPMLIKCNNV